MFCQCLFCVYIFLFWLSCQKCVSLFVELDCGACLSICVDFRSYIGHVISM